MAIQLAEVDEVVDEISPEEAAIRDSVIQATEDGNAPDPATPDYATVDPEAMAELEKSKPSLLEGLAKLAEIAGPEAIAEMERNAIADRQQTRTALDDLLDEISNAHLACTRAASEVFLADSAVKAAKANHKSKEEAYNQCVSSLLELTSKITNDSTRPLFPLSTPSETVEATDVAPDAGTITSDAIPDDASHTDTPTALAWRATSIDVLPLSASLNEKLREGDVATMGELADLIERAENNPSVWPKGIGPTKRTTITDALIAWQAERERGDSTSVPVTVVGDFSIPSADVWNSMSHAAQISWLNARAVYLEEQAAHDPELSTIDVLDYRNTENEIPWHEGVVAFEEGDLASNCPYGLGEDCDAWLTGWLWAGKREEGE